MRTTHAQLTTEDHGSQGNTWMAYSFHPGSWVCFASLRAIQGVNLPFLNPWQGQGLGTADILEGNSWGPLLCIHPYEHSVACCWEGKRHRNEARQSTILQTKNCFRNKQALYERGSKTLAVAPTQHLLKWVQAVTSVFQESPGLQVASKIFIRPVWKIRLQNPQ